MVVDTALWLIFAAMIGLVACGCILTTPEAERAARHHDDARNRLFHA